MIALSDNASSEAKKNWLLLFLCKRCYVTYFIICLRVCMCMNMPCEFSCMHYLYCRVFLILEDIISNHDYFTEWPRRQKNNLYKNRRLIAVIVLLVLLLLVQDAVFEDGLNRGIFISVILLVFDAMSHVTIAAANILVRPFPCLCSCGLEIIMALTDIIYSLLRLVVLVASDLVCIPWQLLGMRLQLSILLLNIFIISFSLFFALL